MTLPKSARTLRFGGKVYRWMVGKINHEHANVVVETPSKETWTFYVRVRKYRSELPGYEWDSGYEGIPVTPEKVRGLIEDKLLDIGWD